MKSFHTSKGFWHFPFIYFISLQVEKKISKSAHAICGTTQIAIYYYS